MGQFANGSTCLRWRLAQLGNRALPATKILGTFGGTLYFHSLNHLVSLAATESDEVPAACALVCASASARSL
jgi:hypothetical protein